MAKYNIKHSCGCVVEHNLFGKNDYREYKINKLQNEKCYVCCKKEKVQEMLNSGIYEVKEISYREYKDHNECENDELTAIPDSYNKETKTIKVLVKIEKKEKEMSKKGKSKYCYQIIMARAWEIYKNNNKKIDFSLCLKKSWAIEKAEIAKKEIA